MPFFPLFEEVAESEIVAKMMIVVERDMKQALDWFYLDSATYLTRYGVPNRPSGEELLTGEDLPGFVVMTEGDQDLFTYPLLTLVVQEGNSEESVSGEWLEQELRVGAALAVDGATIKVVRQKAKKYVRALKAVLRKGVLELLPDEDQYTDYSISFRHRYLRHGSKETTFTQPAEMLITMKFGEK